MGSGEPGVTGSPRKVAAHPRIRGPPQTISGPSPKISGPCQKIKPKFLDMARDFAHVLFLVVDVDLNHETAAAVRVHVCACDGDE